MNGRASFSRLREKVPGSAGRMRAVLGIVLRLPTSPLIRHASHATFSRKREKDVPLAIFAAASPDRFPSGE
jgi:hypothetical protein